MDSLKKGWRSTEFALTALVVAAGLALSALGQPWPGLVGAAIATTGYGVARGLSKAAYVSHRGGSQTRVI